ncbi:MAG: formate acetyltransferase [Bacteroidales bacterium]|nr:formate acetyltransferase [Bacteroidales bacterium]
MKTELSPRIAKLRETLMKRGFEDRTKEWFKKNEQADLTKRAWLPDVAKMYPNEHVMIRRAYGVDEMLKAMCNTKDFGYTRCFDIEEGDLLAGTIPMGSNGLGKVFPNYLTEEELRVGSATNKTAMSLLGHNSINYEKVLKNGLQSIINYAEEKLHPKALGDIEDAYDTKAFYKAIIISCKAVIDYASRFANLASEKAKICKDEKRKKELLEIARICNKVPAKPADTFYEAIHSIWLVHCCLHSTMDFMSLGRLDQVLNPYLKKETDKAFACELFENFIIKAAGRLNLTTQYLVTQDHMDYNAALGIHPYYLDQRAGLNNFLQNIIIGGKTPEGKDATNDCTYIILEAFKNVNLSTPGIYVRLHKDSPAKLYAAVSESIKETKNLPYILNDEVMIPAMLSALSFGETKPDKLKKYQELANDYCVDGCWEPILNGISEWTFGMINGMTIMECTLNRGAALTSNPALLRGQKLSIDTGELTDYNSLKNSLTKQIQFFVDQSSLAMCMYYLTSEFVVPSPLVSALFGTCLEKGRDKSWGGAKYNLGGTVLGGVPDMVNTAAAIKKWVFDQKKYKLSDVLMALRFNYTAGDTGDFKTQRLFDSIKVDFFTNSPQFGNDSETNDIAKFILDTFVNAVNQSKALANKVFLDPKGDSNKQICALRAIAGYYGKALQTILPDFDLKFTAGMGTFEQYNWQGAGNAASASRNTGDPLAPNFTPASGTWHTSPANLIETFSQLGLNRFAAGVITDICLESDALLDGIIKTFVQKNGGMLTITIASPQYQEIYEIAKAANLIENPTVASEKLLKYSDIMVRVGGWNAPFITLPISHMENYINRPVKSN